jgi:uncharacterized membrane protein
VKPVLSGRAEISYESARQPVPFIATTVTMIGWSGGWSSACAASAGAVSARNAIVATIALFGLIVTGDLRNVSGPHIIPA